MTEILHHWLENVFHHTVPLAVSLLPDLNMEFLTKKKVKAHHNQRQIRAAEGFKHLPLLEPCRLKANTSLAASCCGCVCPSMRQVGSAAQSQLCTGHQPQHRNPPQPQRTEHPSPCSVQHKQHTAAAPLTVHWDAFPRHCY